MDWIKTVVLIKKKLTERGFDETARKITNAQIVLGTPGEMYLEVMNELLTIKKYSPEEYKVIQQEIQQLLDYGKSINYFNPSE